MSNNIRMQRTPPSAAYGQCYPRFSQPQPPTRTAPFLYVAHLARARRETPRPGISKRASTSSAEDAQKGGQAQSRRLRSPSAVQRSSRRHGASSSLLALAASPSASKSCAQSAPLSSPPAAQRGLSARRGAATTAEPAVRMAPTCPGACCGAHSSATRGRRRL